MKKTVIAFLATTCLTVPALAQADPVAFYRLGADGHSPSTTTPGGDTDNDNDPDTAALTYAPQSRPAGTTDPVIADPDTGDFTPYSYVLLGPEMDGGAVGVDYQTGRITWTPPSDAVGPLRVSVLMYHDSQESSGTVGHFDLTLTGGDYSIAVSPSSPVSIQSGKPGLAPITFTATPSVAQSGGEWAFSQSGSDDLQIQSFGPSATFDVDDVYANTGYLLAGTYSLQFSHKAEGSQTRVVSAPATLIVTPPPEIHYGQTSGPGYRVDTNDNGYSIIQVTPDTTATIQPVYRYGATGIAASYPSWAGNTYGSLPSGVTLNTDGSLSVNSPQTQGNTEFGRTVTGDGAFGSTNALLIVGATLIPPDQDTDNDGIPDLFDPVDNDGDGVPEGVDPDDNDPQVPNPSCQPNIYQCNPDGDADGDGTPDWQDDDIDGDDILNAVDQDRDGDGKPNDKDSHPYDRDRTVTGLVAVDHWLTDMVAPSPLELIPADGSPSAWEIASTYPNPCSLGVMPRYGLDWYGEPVGFPC